METISKDAVNDEINALFDQGNLNLNLGCGRYKLEKCINCDLYDETADKKLDARDLSEYQDGQVNAIYAGQLIEHFSYNEAPLLLREWNRVLRKGGYLIIHLPDMEKIILNAAEWMTGDWKTVARVEGVYQFQSADQIWVSIWNSLMKSIYGWDNDGMHHQWGYSASYLACGLKQCGFKVNKIYKGYPNRPTPSMLIIAEKI